MIFKVGRKILCFMIAVKWPFDTQKENPVYASVVYSRHGCPDASAYTAEAGQTTVREQVEATSCKFTHKEV